MRRFLIILTSSILAAHFSLCPASADSSITLTEPTHRNAEGIFVSDELASAITPEGRLGRLLFQRNSAVTSYYIDMATIDEIQDLADGYSYIDNLGATIDVPEFVIADIWLNTLRSAVTRKTVYALPYGNPDRDFLEKRAPSEYAFLKRLARERLSLFLGMAVDSAESVAGDRRAASAARQLSNIHRRDLRISYSVAPAEEVVALRLQMGQILNSSINKDELPLLIQDLDKSLVNNSKKLRIARGNYTITTASYELPTTITNDFSLPVTVKLRVRPTNSRVIVGDVKPISIPANSQAQVEVPLDVIASGETWLEMQLRTSAGKQIGATEVIPLRLAVISPLTTWFTTGMAILLLLAAAVQSVRRVKKRKQR